MTRTSTVSIALPDFLVIGAMRSGSTAMYRHLGAHPGVRMPHRKEILFFDENYERGIDWYRSHFRGLQGASAIGEASPGYMYEPSAPARMAALLPEARLVAILRHPVDRAYSHYWLNRARGQEELDFADAIEAEPERLLQGASMRRGYSYLDRGRYVRQLERVCEHFPRSSLLALPLDDWQRSPSETYGRVCSFLGIDAGFVPTDVGRPVNHFVSFRAPRLRKTIRRLPGPMRLVSGALNTRPNAMYPALPAEHRRKLLEQFEEDNAALERWLNRDLPAWSR